MRRETLLLLSSFLILFLSGCGGKEEGTPPAGGSSLDGGSPNVSVGASVSSYSFDEPTQTCLNEEGDLGYNSEVGQCSDLSALYSDEVLQAVEDGVDLTGSNASGVDFSGASEVTEEYIMVNSLKYDDSTVLGSGVYAEESHMNAEKSSLCQKWLAKQNKKTGEYPAGIQKKIDRLNCL